MRNILSALSAGLLCTAGIASAQTSSSPNSPDSPTNAAPHRTEMQRIRELEKAVQQLQNENRQLKSEVAGLKSPSPAASATNAPPEAPAVSTPAKPGASRFVLHLGKGTNVKLGGFMQINGEFGDPSSFEGHLAGGPNAVNNRIRIRRARINVTGDIFTQFNYKFEGDFQQGDGIHGRTGFSGTDLFLNWHRFDEANIKVGQFKAPFGYEQLSSDTAIYSIERSLPTDALTPERQVGIQLSGKPLAPLRADLADRVDYAVGIFNGNGRNITVNDGNTFMYAARLDVVPFEGKLLSQPTKWRIGLDGLYSRDAADVNLSPVGNLIVQPDGSLSSFSTHGPDERRAWGVDQTLTWGPFDLRAEYLEEQFRPTTSAATFSKFDANGYYIQGAYFLPGRKWQVVSKWEALNPGQAPHDNIETIMGGLNYYIYGNNLKVMLDYLHTWSDYRSHHPALGSDTFDEVLLRTQLMF